MQSVKHNSRLTDTTVGRMLFASLRIGVNQISWVSVPGVVNRLKIGYRKKYGCIQ